MLKVLAIVPCPQIGGLQVMTLKFFEKLSQRIACHFLVTRWTDGEFSRRLDVLDIPYSYSWLGMFSRKLDRQNLQMTISCVARLPRLYWDFVKLFQSYRPDVIYVGNYHELISLFPVLLPLRVPVVYHAHNPLPTGSFYRFSFNIWGGVVSHYVAVSRKVGLTISQLGVDPNQISVLYNGIDISQFCYNDRRSNMFATRFEWPQDSVIVCMTGQMNKSKGHLDFIEAAQSIGKKHSGVRFVIGGKQEGDYFRELQKKIAENNLGDIVAFSGWQDDMSSFYEASDVLVLPSREDLEGLPLVIAEAMATGLPVIATRSGGAIEIVEDEITGILVERQSPDQLADAITSLVSSSAKRRMMGIAGRRRVEACFELSKQSTRLQTILENVAHRGEKRDLLAQ